MLRKIHLSDTVLNTIEKVLIDSLSYANREQNDEILTAALCLLPQLGKNNVENFLKKRSEKIQKERETTKAQTIKSIKQHGARKADIIKLKRLTAESLSNVFGGSYEQ